MVLTIIIFNVTDSAPLSESRVFIFFLYFIVIIVFITKSDTAFSSRTLNYITFTYMIDFRFVIDGSTIFIMASPGHLE